MGFGGVCGDEGFESFVQIDLSAQGWILLENAGEVRSGACSGAIRNEPNPGGAGRGLGNGVVDWRERHSRSFTKSIGF